MLDAMSWVQVRIIYFFDVSMRLMGFDYPQINTSHWHIVDCQNFPLVVPNYTEIAQEGAYSAEAVYTPQDVPHIVS